jgi:putative membrane protein insertion efficiency factor
MIARLRTWLSEALVLGVRGYRMCIRPLLPDLCQFQPSCSEFFIQAVRKYGPLSGAWRGIKRIARCNPWSRGGYDPP